MADSLDRTSLDEDIEQTRLIRAEQDRAYEESLWIDQEKVITITYSHAGITIKLHSHADITINADITITYSHADITITYSHADITITYSHAGITITYSHAGITITYSHTLNYNYA